VVFVHKKPGMMAWCMQETLILQVDNSVGNIEFAGI
jgi:hypothetical protein